MSQSLFRRMFGRSSKLAPAVSEAIAELDRLAQERPSLARHAQALAQALPMICASVAISEWKLPAERIAAKWTAGVPLLRGEALPLDPREFSRRWLALCDILADSVGKGPASALAKAMRQGDLPVEELTGWVLSGQIDALRARAEALGLDAELAATVLRWTLFPILMQLQQSMPELPADPWPHGFCPICGSWPILGEFRGLEQVRFLRCGLCAAAWEFPRLRCPFCDNTDHRQLGYLHCEGNEGQQRVATCDACRANLKVVAALTPLTPTRLLVADVATLHLDLIAAERGYGAG